MGRVRGQEVTAPIFMHGKWEDNYDDPSHPIPSLTALDVQAIKKGGGSDLLIIIASPLQADERSQRRLLDKMEIYLKFLKTPEFESTLKDAPQLPTHALHLSISSKTMG
jgi:hypothetical protein